jgi:hypothetical protein
MPELPMPEPESEAERYLRLVDRRLPFDDDERAEILDELRGHLEDTAAGFRERGLAPDEADRAAVERLGSAEKLADELMRARRDTSRLLAAAGAGAWGLLRGGAWGGLVGVGFLVVVYTIVVFLTNLATYQLGVSWAGFGNSATGAFGEVEIGFALLIAGRVATPAIAARAARPGRSVRLLTVPIGAAMALAYALVGWSGPLDWLAVVLLVSLPLWWIAGAWQTSPIRLGYPSRLVKSLGVILVVGIAASLLATGTFPWSRAYVPPGQPEVPPGHVVVDQGFDRIAPQAPAGVSNATLFDTTIATGSVGEPIASVVMTGRTPLANWTDLRVEAWATAKADGYWLVVDPTATQPLATAPVEWLSGARTLDGIDMTSDAEQSIGTPLPRSLSTLSGRVTVRLTQPAIVCLAVTGVAPDGRRYLVQFPNGGSFVRVSFEGSALDWIETVLAGH